MLRLAGPDRGHRGAPARAPVRAPNPSATPRALATEATLGMVGFGSLRSEAPLHLCQICGLALAKPVLFGVVQLVEMRETSGAGCHPRCFALALRHCPHFDARYSADEAVAFVYHGEGPGVRVQHRSWGPDRFDVDPDAEPVTRAEVCRLVGLERKASGSTAPAGLGCTITAARELRKDVG